MRQEHVRQEHVESELFLFLKDYSLVLKKYLCVARAPMRVYVCARARTHAYIGMRKTGMSETLELEFHTVLSFQICIQVVLCKTSNF